VDLPRAQFLRLDLFPAIVKGESVLGTVVDRTRAVVTDAHVHVIRLTPVGEPELVHSWELDSFEGKPGVGYTAVTTDGDVVSIKRSTGCGCGATRLKGLKLFDYIVPYRADL
jgi:hypothetical protein